jgi:hypothetical protein
VHLALAQAEDKREPELVAVAAGPRQAAGIEDHMHRTGVVFQEQTPTILNSYGIQSRERHSPPALQDRHEHCEEELAHQLQDL